jgi:periplasmic copper chaperone A
MHYDAKSLRRLNWACGLVLMLFAAHVNALFIVNQPWARPANAGRSTEVYMNLTSTDGATLVAVRTDAAKGIAIRAPGKGVQSADRLPLPPGTLVALAPGKDRLAMIGLTRNAKLGDQIVLTLTIEAVDGTRQDIPVLAEVRMRSPIDDELHSGHKHSH